MILFFYLLSLLPLVEPVRAGDVGALEFTSGANGSARAGASGWRVAILFPANVNPESCARLKLQMYSASPHVEVSECFSDLEAARNSPGMPFHFLFKVKSQSLLTVESLPAAPFQFEPVQKETKSLDRFFLTLERARAQQEVALIVALSESKRLKLNADGAYLDSLEKKVLNFEEACALFQDESPRQKNYWRAVKELSLVLGLGVGWYVMSLDFNKPDWKLDGRWKSWRKKIITGEAIRFDSNTITTNISAHPWTGALYYSLARQNGLNSLEAFLLGFTASAVWEFLIEYREYVSINDLIMTPVAGQALGEVFTQLGLFFSRGGDTPLNRALSTLFGGPQRFHDWVDEKAAGFRKNHSKNLDKFGFSKDVFHRFQLSAALGSQNFSNTRSGLLSEIRLETHLVHIPGYASETGAKTQLLYDTAMTDLVVRAGKSSSGFQEIMLYARAALAGYHQQSISPGKQKDVLNGYRFFMGPSVGYSLEARDFPDGKGATLSEGIGIAHVFGSSIDLMILKEELKIRFTLDVFGDFAAIRSLAIEPYLDKHCAKSQALRNCEVWPSSTLRSPSHYDFHFGVSVKTGAVIEYRRAEIGVEAQVNDYSGIQGHDDYQEYIDQFEGKNPTATEELQRIRGWIGYLLPGERWKLLLSLEARWRKSGIGEVEARQSDVRALGNAMFQF